jgi:serine/threonine-protein kinase
VWFAVDAELREEVAIKVLRGDLAPEARERLKREVSIGRTLPHPNLARVYELLDLGDRLAVVMEYLPGGSLADRLAAGEVAIADAVRWTEQALSALAHLHEHGVVHRDVKPSNLLLDAAGVAKLADLGLAKRVDGGDDLTRTATTVGTPMFMSPEQVRGEDATPASDLYALGVTLFQLLSGRPPFQAKSEFEVARLHLQEPAPDPRRLRPDCPAWLGRFVLRLMEKRPRDRYRDARAALESLCRQRAFVSLRLRRRVFAWTAATAAGALLALGAASVVRARAEVRRVVRVEAADNVVHGLDASGVEVWRVALAARVEQVEHADLDGDGIPDLVAVTRPADHARKAATKSEVLAVTRSGRVITRVSPEDVVEAWPYEFPRVLRPAVQVVDVDGDRRAELLVNCAQAQFYPTVLLVYWPASDRWTTATRHSGRIRDLAVIPGASEPSLLVVGLNNRIGVLGVVGELALGRPGRYAGVLNSAPAPSPEEESVVGAASGWRWYTPLGEGFDPSHVVRSTGGDIAITSGQGATLRLDAFGNPTPGPNAGRDLRRERCAFFAELATIESPSTQPASATDAASALAALEREAVALLDEPPYRAVLALGAARVLARTGDPAAAQRTLESTRAVVPYEEIAYRLAHFYALARRETEAANLLKDIIASRRTVRGQYDAIHLLLRLGIERRDGDLVRDAIGRFSSMRPDEVGGRMAVALAARAHVWWDEATPGDAAAQSWAYAPDGAAMAVLARWRTGRATETDLSIAREAIAANPEARWEGELALAAVEIATGRATDAVVRAGTVIAALEPISRDDFMNRQVLDLARAMFVRALADSGQRADAAREAKAIRPLLRDGLLPAILVDEELAATRRSGTAR